MGGTVPDDDEVICPGCSHQFRAVPVNVQREVSRLRGVVRRFVQAYDDSAAEVVRFSGGHASWCVTRRYPSMSACDCGLEGAKRTKESDEVSWTCEFCGQANFGWAKACGRCSGVRRETW